MIQQKKCSKCGEVKDLASFYVNNKGTSDKRRPDCIDCSKLYHNENKIARNRRCLEYRNKNIDSINKKRRDQYHNSNKDHYYNQNLRKLYKIDIDQYNAMLSEQNNVCKICEKPNRVKNKRLYVDHCHKTGVVRGLLCHHCNILLGCAKDSIKILVNSISYLKSRGVSLE